MALGLLVALTPYVLFTVCQTGVPTASGSFVPMKCFWTARASLGNGGLIVFSGLVLCIARHPGVRLGAALVTAAAGTLAILTPVWVIGVCPGGMMPCHMGTRPALILLGLLTVLAAALIALRARRDMTASTRNRRHSDEVRP